SNSEYASDGRRDGWATWWLSNRYWCWPYCWCASYAVRWFYIYDVRCFDNYCWNHFRGLLQKRQKNEAVSCIFNLCINLVVLNGYHFFFLKVILICINIGRCLLYYYILSK